MPLHRRLRAPLAIVCVVTAALVLAAPAAAVDTLTWDNGALYASFGANEEVVISLGTITFVRGCANPDFVSAFTDAYVVPHGSVAGFGTALPPIAVGGEPHVLISTVSNGLFVDESLGFTGPGGRIGKGVWDVVYDNCQDGVFDAADTVFSPAFSVDYPQNIPAEPTPQILSA